MHTLYLLKKSIQDYIAVLELLTIDTYCLRAIHTTAQLILRAVIVITLATAKSRNSR